MDLNALSSRSFHCCCTRYHHPTPYSAMFINNHLPLHLVMIHSLYYKHTGGNSNCSIGICSLIIDVKVIESLPKISLWSVKKRNDEYFVYSTLL